MSFNYPAILVIYQPTNLLADKHYSARQASALRRSATHSVNTKNQCASHCRADLNGLSGLPAKDSRLIVRLRSVMAQLLDASHEWERRVSTSLSPRRREQNKELIPYIKIYLFNIINKICVLSPLALFSPRYPLLYPLP